MGFPRLNTLIPTQKYDFVAVFDQNLNQVFVNARPLKAQVKEESKVMEHPVENGTIITDHRIILPIEIELSMFVEAQNLQDTYKTMRQLYLSATLLVVQTRAGVYRNQMIQSMPNQEDPDYYGSLTIALKLKQVQFTTAKYAVLPKRPKNSSTVDRGTQQAQPVPKGSYLSQLDDAVNKMVGK